MAGSNAVPVAAGLVSVITSALASAYPSDPEVRVDFAYNGKQATRKYVYVGRIAGPQAPATFQEAAVNARINRQEDITIQLHVEVKAPNYTAQDAAQQASDIGALIEGAIAADPKGSTANVPGLLAWMVTHHELTPFYLEDGVAAAEGLYTVSATSMLG